MLLEIGFLGGRERGGKEGKKGSVRSQQYSEVTSSIPATWKGGQVRAQHQDKAWGMREVTHMEVAVHVEPHDAKVVGAGDVGDDALPALPLLGHPHPHVPVPELGRKNCHSSLGT